MDSISSEIYEYYQIIRKARNYKVCYANGHGSCRGKIILAHSISKSKALAAISKSGKIYVIRSGFADFDFEFSDIDIRKASTFTGFCALHDGLLFQLIDRNPFDFTDEAIKQYHLRTVAHELFKKETNSIGFSELSKIQNNEKVIDLEIIEGIDEYTKIAIRDFKQELKETLASRNTLNYRVIEFDRFEIPHVSSSLFVVNYDYKGNEMFDFDDFSKHAPLISINSIRNGNKQYFLFSWNIKHDYVCLKWLDSFIDGAKTGKKLFSLILHISENLYFDIQWVDSLLKNEKAILINAFERVIKSGSDFPFESIYQMLLPFRDISSYPKIRNMA